MATPTKGALDAYRNLANVFMREYVAGFKVGRRCFQNLTARGKSLAHFAWQYRGYDPYNHRGQYMYPPPLLQHSEIRHSLYTIDDFVPGYDPRNHTGYLL